MKRLTPASLSMIMFMVIGGLVVAYVAKGLLAVEKRPQIAERNIPMAVTDIQPGTVLTEQHIGMGPIRESDLRPDMLLNNRIIVGRVVKEKLQAARPIHASQLYEPGAGPPLKVEPGMRAVTLDFPESSSILEGLIKPGQFCDVHMSVNDASADDRTGGGITLTLFKGVRILAINRLTQQTQIDQDANSVTLELTPAQANIAILARQKGRLSLSYNPHGKGSGGIAVKNEDRVMLYEILGLEPKKLPPEPFTTQVYRGSGRQQLQFRGNNIVDETSGGYIRPLPPQPNAAPPAGTDSGVRPADPAPAAGPRTSLSQPANPLGPPNMSVPNPLDFTSTPLNFAIPPGSVPPGIVYWPRM